MIRLHHALLPAPAEAVRHEVRAFLAEAHATGVFEPRCDAWLTGFSPEFSRALGERGWIGMTWAKEYGGHDRTSLDRFVVLEELLAAGAPVAAHWIADRQSGPQIFRHGTIEAKQRLLPAIARGECFVAIGMSEPDSGSDLASIRTSATRVDRGWRVSGAKIWTSHAHRSHFITVLCRTGGGERHQGLSVLVVDLAAPGVTVRPITMLNGQADLNEVVLDGVFVPDEMLLGVEGEGWKLITSELALERSGPERILSTFPLFIELVRCTAGSVGVEVEIGMLAAELWTLRQLSIAVACEIDRGRDPSIEAALVKDLGTHFEARVVEVARRAYLRERSAHGVLLESLLEQALLASPGFTLRGGTTEILRGIVARSLGAVA